MENSPEISDVTKKLVDNGATYVAVNTWSLVDEPAQFYYHLPVGTSDENQETVHTYLDQTVGHLPDQRRAGTIQIAGQSISACVDHVLHNSFHLYRRTPVFIDESVPGLDPVAIDEGVTNVEEVVENQPDIDPRPARTVSLEELLQYLADAGAVSAELRHQWLVADEPEVHLRVPIVPSDAYPFLGDIESVEITGETYPLYPTLTLDGPASFGLDRTALYVSPSVKGANPVSVDEGAEKGRELLQKAKNADSTRELTPP